MNYNFDVRKLVTMLLPSFLRKSKQIAWLVALLAPLNRLRTEFIAFISQTRYNVSLTGQVTILQMHLNNVFDFAERRILILNGDAVGNYVWYKSENQASDFVRFKNETNDYNIFLRFSSEPNQVGVGLDFLVQVPMEYQGLEDRIKSVINQYKLAGKRYKIIFVL